MWSHSVTESYTRVKLFCHWVLHSCEVILSLSSTLVWSCSVHCRCEVLPQTLAALVINNMSGSKAIHGSSDGCVGGNNYSQDEETSGILVCGRGWVTRHLESYPAQEKDGPRCAPERAHGVFPGGALENMTEWKDWVEMMDSQCKQTLRCKTVRLSLIWFQSQGCFPWILNDSYMSIHEWWAYVLFSFAVLWVPCSTNATNTLAPQTPLKSLATWLKTTVPASDWSLSS